MVKNTDQLSILTEKGHIETVEVATLKNTDRYTNGSFIFDESESGKAKEMWKIPIEESNEELNNRKRSVSIETDFF